MYYPINYHTRRPPLPTPVPLPFPHFRSTHLVTGYMKPLNYSLIYNTIVTYQGIDSLSETGVVPLNHINTIFMGRFSPPALPTFTNAISNHMEVLDI